MSVRRPAPPRTTVLAALVAATLGGLAVPVLTTGSAASAAPAEGSCENPQEPPAELPPGVEDGDLLFVSQYHPVLVQLTCGRLELVELTGWDSCYFLDGDDVVRYPC
jgi:hypothetical protein